MEDRHSRSSQEPEKTEAKRSKCARAKAVAAVKSHVFIEMLSFKCGEISVALNYSDVFLLLFKEEDI